MFPRCIITEFERKIDVQNHEFGWVRFQNRFFKLSSNVFFLIKIPANLQIIFVIKERLYKLLIEYDFLFLDDKSS